MNAHNGSIRSTILVMAILAVGSQAGIRSLAAAEADGGLKWTPHRGSSMPATADFPAAPESSAPGYVMESEEFAGGVPSGPPASVSLPDEVPAIQQMAPRRMAARAIPPRRPTPPPPAWTTGGGMRRIYDPGNPDSVFGINILRTPQGPQNRSILAPEGPQAVAMRVAADQQMLGDERFGGGLAPRYQTAARTAPQRPERLAMNVDGIPSVMTRAPQAQSLEGGRSAGIPEPALARQVQPQPVADRGPSMDAIESIGPGIEMPDSYDEMMPDQAYGDGMPDPDYSGGLLMGEYPTELHVESFYDDPYACEDEGLMPLWHHDGRFCAWLRRFGRPYYGWRWYRDFTASAGITGFTNATDLGINGNFGTNEALNFAMPFWNAFGVGWQVGWRGVQTNFQPATIEVGNQTFKKNARTQQFLTTGFFTRAFEGRGLQGGIAYDYLHDSWLDNTDVSQLRYEASYVYGYHELGFWGASNIGDQDGLFGPITKQSGVASTLNLYTGFYRLQFGDANEWKVWGGGTSESDGIIGTLVRAPMHRSLALEGTFTYVIPGRNQTINFDGQGAASTYPPSAWNVSVNVVWYPAARSRRSLASPYRPLFEVADNGSMIRSIQPLLP